MASLALDIRDYFNRGVNSGGTALPIKNSPYQNGLFSFASVMLKNIYIISSIILLFFIVFGGLTMILNAGNLEKQKQGSKTITAAIAGFFIMFTAYWIIKIIEKITGAAILEL